MRKINKHFSKIEPKYRELRNTDLEPIHYIKRALNHLTYIEAADVDCGAGRYDISLFQSLKEGCISIVLIAIKICRIICSHIYRKIKLADLK